MSVLDRKELEQSPLADLHAIASELGVEGYRRLRKEELISAILDGEDGDAAPEEESGDSPEAEAEPAEIAEEPEADEPEPEREEREERKSRSRRGGRSRSAKRDEPEDEVAEEEEDADEADEPEEEDLRSGVLDILPNGSGFMRPDPFAHSREDVYVSPAQIRRCELRAGDEINGPVRPPRRSERYPSLVRVDTVNSASPEPPADRPRFEQLTPVFASERLPAPDGLDAVAYGKGSRVAIAGPPGAGATALLRRIVGTLAESQPDLAPIVVLAGVRPEEVTEWRRDSGVTVAGGAFDGSVDEQAQIAEMAIERAKRVVEAGRDAVVAIDSLDSLPPAVARRVFGAARRAEEGGSLTVVAVVGEAPEPLRVATTRIVLVGGAVGPASGTTRADLLNT
jgi:transcription termination factor Rho